MKKVLFVCTGNTCRSPMAEGIFNKLALESGIGRAWRAYSAGLYVDPGRSASFNSIDVSKRHGIDISGSVTKGVGDFNLEGCALVLTMTLFQKEEIVSRYPAMEGRVMTIAQWGFEDDDLAVDIEDPFGMGMEVYERMYDALSYYIKGGIARLAGEHNRAQKKVAIGSDHGGYELKEQLAEFLRGAGYEVSDFGCTGKSSTDYPKYAFLVAQSVARGDNAFGVLVCTTGVGMSIAANKVAGVRAALCHDLNTAGKSRAHNDANVLCMGAAEVEAGMAKAMVETFLETPFEGGRHQKRVGMINDYKPEGGWPQ